MSELLLKDLMVKAFDEELTKIFIREEKEPNYMNADQYDTNKERMEHAVIKAIKRPINIGSLGSALHRASAHTEEESKVESESLISVMSVEDVTSVETQAFWSIG